MIALIVTLQIKPGMREKFLAAIEDDAICSTRDEPGCLRFNVLQDTSDADRFHLFEVYRDQAALEAHRKSPHYARWTTAATETVANRELRVATPVLPRDAAAWKQ